MDDAVGYFPTAAQEAEPNIFGNPWVQSSQLQAGSAAAAAGEHASTRARATAVRTSPRNDEDRRAYRRRDLVPPLLSYHACLTKLRDPPRLELSLYISTDATMKTKNEVTSTDPIARLPPEIFEKVLQHIPYPLILDTKLVSRAWYSLVWDYVNRYDDAWISFDFRKLGLARVTPEFLVACIERANGGVQEVILPALTAADEYAAVLRALVLCRHAPSSSFTRDLHVDGVPYAGSAAVWGVDPQCLVRVAAPFLTRLVRVQFDDGFGAVLADWRNFRMPTAELFAQLEEVRVSMRVMSRLFEFVGSTADRVWFANLRVLGFATEDDEEVDDDADDEGDVDEVAHEDDREHSTDINDNDAAADQVWPDMQRVVVNRGYPLFPRLQILDIQGCPPRLLRRRGRGRRQRTVLDRQCLDYLLSWMPELSLLRCRAIAVVGRSNYNFVYPRLSLRCNMNLREFDFSYSNTTALPVMHTTCKTIRLRECKVWQSDTSADAGNFYAHVVALDLSGALTARGMPITIAYLAALFPQSGRARLRCLNLSRCVGIEMSINNVAEMAGLFPGLEVFRICESAGIDDAALRIMYTTLPRLSLLDVSRTSITDVGVVGLLSDRENGMATQLATIIVDGCDSVSADAVAALQRSGIDTTPQQEVDEVKWWC
ncbi:uncharacterized protein V1518DRAFT_409688 [Limtongia smithiae]|uniref:uncharacterized protein n=1 Tax=Limtongia smithiae TaxID=1125753 RepID=UPI0034CEFE27